MTHIGHGATVEVGGKTLGVLSGPMIVCRGIVDLADFLPLFRRRCAARVACDQTRRRKIREFKREWRRLNRSCPLSEPVIIEANFAGGPALSTKELAEMLQ